MNINAVHSEHLIEIEMFQQIVKYSVQQPSPPQSFDNVFIRKFIKLFT